jgi:hypothetical protein
MIRHKKLFKTYNKSLSLHLISKTDKYLKILLKDQKIENKIHNKEIKLI